MSDSWFVGLAQDDAIDNLRRQWRFGDKNKANRWNRVWLSTFGVDLIQHIEEQDGAGPKESETDSEVDTPVPSATHLHYGVSSGGNGLRGLIRFSGGLVVIVGILAVVVGAILMLLSLSAGAVLLIPAMWSGVSGVSSIVFGGVAYMLCSIDERLQYVRPR